MAVWIGGRMRIILMVLVVENVEEKDSERSKDREERRPCFI